MSCVHKRNSACPFAYTDESAIAQNYGCLPTQEHIKNMRVFHGKTWACHDNPTKPCAGAICRLKEQGLPHTIIDRALLTERSPWHLYADEPMIQPNMPWPFPTQLPPNRPIPPMPFNPNNHEDAPW